MLWEEKGIEGLVKALPPAQQADAKLVRILRAIAKGYPNDFTGIELGQPLRLLLANDRAVIYDDGRQRSFEELLEAPDLEDTFSQVYPLTNPTDRLPENFDPGRFRVDEMFRAVYGDSEQAVRANCVAVDFCGQKVSFNERNGAAEALRAASADLSELLKTKPELRVYVTKLGGTFNWRKVAGTDRLSNHSFGAAIDLNVDKSAYWRWQPAATLPSFSRLNWPTEIIEAFERHGFIWGGKWYHYDTMHFEYRPELLP